MLDDKMIRAELDRWLTALAKQRDHTILVRHELGVIEGTSRVDMATIGHELHGFEIKSDVDTLARLPKQVREFNRVFNKLTLVTTPKYAAKAAELIPDFWGLILAMEDDGSVALEVIRKPEKNPTTEPMAVAQLLWKDEVVSILKGLGAYKGMSKARRWLLWERLCETATPEEVARITRATLLERNWERFT